MLRDLGSHLLDLTFWLLGFPKVEQVLSANFSLFVPALAAAAGKSADAEDFASGLLRLEGGTAVQLEINFGSHIEKEEVYLDIYGTTGGATTRGAAGLALFAADRSAITKTTPMRLTIASESTQAHFVHCLQSGREPLVTPEQGIAVIRVLDALYAGGIRAALGATERPAAIG